MKIWDEAQAMTKDTVAMRRDFHQYPEAAWTEFRTASIVIKKLQSLGYEVKFGSEVIDSKAMMGVPDKVNLKKCMERAIKEGADPDLVKKMAGGKTGVMGMMHFAKPGKVVGLRFDMDCIEVDEDTSEKHRPTAEGFRSKHPNLMHACGHDGHTTIGLTVAKLVAEHKSEMAGTIKFFFQPGEEGVRGAKAMVASGIADDVDYLIGGHLGFGARKDDMLVCMTEGFLATSKIDAHFTGVSSHAGAAPEKGKNALLAAAEASLALHTISRHSGGSSRINVGVLRAGTGRNVLPDVGMLKFETRGSTTEINDYMVTEAKRMIKSAASMYDVKVKMEAVGGADSCNSSPVMGHEIYEIFKKNKLFDTVQETIHMGGSEDCSYFMKRVQDKGGQAVYMMYGTPIAAGHHNRSFDFNEGVLTKAAGALTLLVCYFGNKK